MRRTYEISRAGSATNRTEVGRVTRLVVNGPSAERDVAFDADALGVHRIELSSGNVYDSSGKLLYNEKEAMAKMDRLSGVRATKRPWYIPVLALLAAICLVIGYRRLRARTPGRLAVERR
ncbi:MAG: hypothetical protein IPJ41_17490 [Phycisphaerales bacterium]|nr:hypothetical protein [Phycisphaerales bacterium]